MADKPDGVPLGGLHRALATGRFTVTAEIGPPRGAATGPVRRSAALLRGWVDAVNITDNPGASVRLSSLAGSLAALEAGVPPIMQLTCRDRNRIALQSELLSAAALGIPNVLLMTGDDPRHGDHPDAKPVFDLHSTQLMRVARTMRDEGRLMSGRRLRPAPRWLIGAVDSPAWPLDAAAMRNSTDRLTAKVEAGAQFVQTQFVFDVPAFARWMAAVRDLGLHQRCYILAGVGPVLSLRALHHLQHLPGVYLPEPVADRLRAAGEAGIAEEGIRLCAETIGQLRQVPGVAGVHVMAVASESTIPGILGRAGLTARVERAGAGQAGPEPAEHTGAQRTGAERALREPAGAAPGDRRDTGGG
jgi:methylenetetrahydrofolate reductase (NADPH)